jgi:NAD(P)-dependent dehydrogenase (short-subunit alcohol dehydrogenase family)
MNLEGKTYIVTGASSGIGNQICIDIAKLGGIVIAMGRNEERLKETINTLPHEGHSYLVGDLADFETLTSQVKQMPGINGIIHSAGIATYLPFKAISNANLREIQQINYEAPLLLTQLLLKNKKISKGGSIVFIASISAMIGVVGNSLYAGSKAGLVAASRAMALELATQKIRVNCISPGMVITPMTEKIQATISEEAFKENEMLHPLGFGYPEDISNVVTFLLDDGSRWITGSNIVVDGGYTCK